MTQSHTLTSQSSRAAARIEGTPAVSACMTRRAYAETHAEETIRGGYSAAYELGAMGYGRRGYSF